MLILKTKAAWQLSLRRRPEALTPNDRIAIKEQKKIMNWLLLKRKKLLLEDDLSTNADSILKLSRQVDAIYYNLQYVKFQTVSLPNGMLYHVFGPVPCRQGDMFTLPQSQIQNKLKDVMASFEVKYHVYGDSAYSRNEEITAHIEGSSLTDRQKTENKCFNACRESIEWGNKAIKFFFKASVYDTGLRLKAMDIASMLQCCIFFTNCLCAMYGNQTSEY